MQEVVSANKKLYKQIKKKVEICVKIKTSQNLDTENKNTRGNTSSNPSSRSGMFYHRDFWCKRNCPYNLNGFISGSSSQNPKFNHCTHEPQCLIRQPIPHLFPLIAYLVNHTSLYHEKLQGKGGREYGDMPDLCKAIEYERYGCESCIWKKHFWTLHGYPDINPWDFKQYQWYRMMNYVTECQV